MDFFSAVHTAFTAFPPLTPMGMLVAPFVLLEPSAPAPTYLNSALPQGAEVQNVGAVPPGPIDCDGKLRPGWVSDGSHMSLPRPAGCPTPSSGEEAKTTVVGASASTSTSAGEGGTVAETQQPKQGDNGDQKADEPKPQSEKQKPEKSAEKPQGEQQKSEKRGEEPAASDSGKTVGDAGYNRPSGPSRIDVAEMALAAQRFSRALIAQHQLLGHGALASFDDGRLGTADGMLWMSPVAGLGRIAQSHGGQLRYDSKGVFVGVDRSYGNVLVGGMLGHLLTSGRSANGDAYHSAFHGAFYGRVDLGSFVLRGDIGGSFNSYGLSWRSFAARSSRGPQRFNATGYGVSGSAFAGYMIEASGIRVVPEIGLEFDRITMSGARGMVAAARPDLAGTMAVNTLRGLIGGRMEMPLALKGTDGLSVKLTAYWARDLIADRPRTGVAVPAVLNQVVLDQTAARSRKHSADAAILGAEIEGRLSKDATIVASYVTELRGAETSHAVLAGLRLKW